MASLLVGLTGGIGTGKSVVADVFREFGAVMVSGDELGREVLESSPELLDAVRAQFGDDVFESDGTLDRRALGERAFASAESASWLTRLTFPGIYARWRKAAAQADGVAVFDAALVFEWRIEPEFDLVIVVSASREVVRERLVRANRLSPSEFEARFSSQTLPEEKARRAHVVIENNGSLERLRAEARRVWIERIEPELTRRRLKPDDSER